MPGRYAHSLVHVPQVKSTTEPHPSTKSRAKANEQRDSMDGSPTPETSSAEVSEIAILTFVFPRYRES